MILTTQTESSHRHETTGISPFVIEVSDGDTSIVVPYPMSQGVATADHKTAFAEALKAANAEGYGCHVGFLLLGFPDGPPEMGLHPVYRQMSHLDFGQAVDAAAGVLDPVTVGVKGVGEPTASDDRPRPAEPPAKIGFTAEFLAGLARDPQQFPGGGKPEAGTAPVDGYEFWLAGQPYFFPGRWTVALDKAAELAADMSAVCEKIVWHHNGLKKPVPESCLGIVKWHADGIAALRRAANSTCNCGSPLCAVYRLYGEPG